MILSDTLSRRPDFIPDKDTDNENMVLLPDKLFESTSLTIHLIDTDLQRKIANSNNLNMEAIKAIELLLGNGPMNLQKDLERLKNLKERTSYSTKGRTTFLRTMNFDRKSPLNFMIKF